MKIKKFTFNPFGENTYIMYDHTHQCVIVDPGCYTPDEQQQLVDFIDQYDLVPKVLLNTHCHLDHICGNHFVAQRYNLELWATELDEYNLELSVSAGQNYGFPITPSPPIAHYLPTSGTFTFGDTSLEIRFTPGHSSGSVSLYHADSGVVVVGDTLFYESIGRYDLPGGDYDTLARSITEQLYSLPDDTIVYSGHGYETTIGHEKRHNPFVKF